MLEDEMQLSAAARSASGPAQLPADQAPSSPAAVKWVGRGAHRRKRHLRTACIAPTAGGAPAALAVATAQAGQARRQGLELDVIAAAGPAAAAVFFNGLLGGGRADTRASFGVRSRTSAGGTVGGAPCRELANKGCRQGERRPGCVWLAVSASALGAAPRPVPLTARTVTTPAAPRAAVSTRPAAALAAPSSLLRRRLRSSSRCRSSLLIVTGRKRLGGDRSVWAPTRWCGPVCATRQQRGACSSSTALAGANRILGASRGRICRPTCILQNAHVGLQAHRR